MGKRRKRKEERRKKEPFSMRFVSWKMALFDTLRLIITSLGYFSSFILPH
jgi:hypothetical protein